MGVGVEGELGGGEGGGEVCELRAPDGEVDSARKEVGFAGGAGGGGEGGGVVDFGGGPGGGGGD